MSLIQPFPGWRPRPDRVREVAAPPYDVLNRTEAATMARGNPHSFLHVSKAEIDLDPKISPHDAQVYQRARHNFLAMQESGILLQDSCPSLYVYRLVQGGHQQTGLVAAISVDAYLTDRVKKHEHTRPDKEDDRTRIADTLGANSGPVFLTYRHERSIDQVLDQVVRREPVFDFVADDGIRHTLWVVSEKAFIDQLVGLFDTLAALYIADGHHRAAAASRVSRARRAERGSCTGEEPFNRFMGVMFPDDQVRILEYNRVVRDLSGMTPETFLARVAERFDLQPDNQPVQPDRPHVFGMFLRDRWYRLTCRIDLASLQDPIARLDVSILQNHLLEPLLEIKNPRVDDRIDFVGGIRGLTGLVERVRSGEMAVAFSLHPTSVTDLMTVADAGGVMPPKSTWFEPKLRDGMVIQGI
ncbi:MAG: DUF1015 domain-containing protein [Magnetococcales bacterium]|nr:DUF1015 domain-containing protein [Magnetococcales bacterium]MBF0322639.1 DUF1015 domain-containing protein [Magnetococcales bacterium]